MGHVALRYMPTNTIRVLQEAARLALEEGLEKRYLRHEVASHALREDAVS
jgi:aspartate aminotransferase-like enzyme